MPRLALTLLLACSKSATPTAIALSVDLSLNEGIDQFMITGLLEPAGATLFGPKPTPDVPVIVDAPRKTVDVIVPDVLGDTRIFVRVDGLAAGDIVATEVAAVDLKKGAKVPLVVTLGARAVCGDHVLRAPFEACDDGNNDAGDGCAACAVEEGWSCGAVCQRCGDGVWQGTEACDDGNAQPGDGCSGCMVETGWACTAAAGCGSCGNGKRDGNEQCDAGDLAAQTCLSVGHVSVMAADASLGLRCRPDCTFDTSQCGAPIDSVATLRTAIASAYVQQALASRITVGVPPGDFIADNSIELDECAGAPCTAPRPFGIELVGLGPTPSTFTTGGNGAVFTVKSPNNAFAALRFTNARLAVAINKAARDTRIHRVQFEAAVGVDGFVETRARNTQVTMSLFSASAGAGFGIASRGDGSVTIVGNVFGGVFDGLGLGAVSLDPAAATYVEHNTFVLNPGRLLPSRAVGLGGGSGPICVANNVITTGKDANNTRGYYFGANVPSADGCLSGETEHNVVFNVQTACEPADDARCLLETCAGYCDLTLDPQLTDKLCPGPALIDAASDRSWDLLPEAAELRFVGANPDLGALESGAPPCRN